MKYDENYYIFNAQDKDRPALWFYYRLWKHYCGNVTTLEFGCGVGHLARRLSASAKVFGIEINPYAIGQIPINAPKVTVRSSLDEIEDGSLGSIISLHVLEHIPDTELSQLGQQFRRKLRPRGRAIFVMPDLGGIPSVIKGSRWMGRRDPTHINLKTANEWYALFKNNWEFDVIKYGADGYYDFPYSKSVIGCVISDFFRAARTGIQFLLGRLFLRPGDGEAVIFILEKHG